MIGFDLQMMANLLLGLAITAFALSIALAALGAWAFWRDALDDRAANHHATPSPPAWHPEHPDNDHAWRRLEDIRIALAARRAAHQRRHP